jgi:hypothetical protein
VIELPELGQVLNEGRDDLLRRVQRAQRVGDDECLEPGQRIERNLRHLALVQLLDSYAAVMRERHRRRTEVSRVGDREVHLVLRGHGAFERHAVGLGHLVAVAMLDEVEPLLFLQRRFQIRSPAEETGLALLADATFEDRLDEHRAVAVDQRFDFVFGGTRTEHLGGGKLDELQ